MSFIDDGQDAYYDGEDLHDSSVSPWLEACGFVSAPPNPPVADEDTAE